MRSLQVFKTIDDVLRYWIKENPDAAERDTRNAVWAHLTEETDGGMSRFRELYDDWFNRNYRHLKIIRSPHQVAVLRRERENRRETVRAGVKKLRPAIQQMILMNWTLPDGTTLRDATKERLEKFGGYFALVAKQLKSGQVVGKHLTENDLQNLWKRAA